MSFYTVAIRGQKVVLQNNGVVGVIPMWGFDPSQIRPLIEALEKAELALMTKDPPQWQWIIPD